MWEIIQRRISPPSPPVLITLSATVREVYTVVTGHRSFVCESQISRAANWVDEFSP